MLIPRLAEEKKRLPRQHFDAYGLGWRLADYGGRLLASHGGGVDGMQSLTALLPEEQLGFAILTNAIPHYLTSALYLSIVDHVLGFADRDWRAEYLEVMRKEQARADENRQKLEAARLKGTRPSLPMAAYTVTIHEPPSTARYSQQNHGKLTLQLGADPQANGCWNTARRHISCAPGHTPHSRDFIPFSLGLDGR